MATIPTDLGGGKLNNDVNNPATILRDIVDDLTSLRAAIIAMNAKLDADAGVTDTNYGALTNPAALKSIKG